MSRTWGVVVPLYKHVGDVLAKVDLSVGCYGLVLHHLQILRGQLQLGKDKGKRDNVSVSNVCLYIYCMCVNYTLSTLYSVVVNCNKIERRARETLTVVAYVCVFLVLFLPCWLQLTWLQCNTQHQPWPSPEPGKLNLKHRNRVY